MESELEFYKKVENKLLFWNRAFLQPANGSQFRIHFTNFIKSIIFLPEKVFSMKMVPFTVPKWAPTENLL